MCLVYGDNSELVRVSDTTWRVQPIAKQPTTKTSSIHIIAAKDSWCVRGDHPLPGGVKSAYFTDRTSAFYFADDLLGAR